VTTDNLDHLGDRVFVTDFDGTMTATDFFDVVLNHADTDSMPDYWGDCVAGRLTHVEALNGIFQHAPRDPGVLETFLSEAQLDPHTKQALEQLHGGGWEVVVVSAGSVWYIERLLCDVRHLVRVIANPGDFTPQTGLTMTWPPADVPWYSRHFGVDKAAVVQQCERSGARVAFAGDGRPDLTAARLVPEQLRFARGWLAETLQHEGLSFRAFERWSDIASMLTAAEG
jgi:2-hydroxy-3-keto-5-methylthiopentenyl-1-phosphate phosphatase